MKLLLALSNEEISKLARAAALKRVSDGTHNFQGDRNPNKARIDNGTHNFLGDNNPNRKLAKLGLQSAKVQKQQQTRVANRTHNWLGGELQRKQVQEQIASGRNVFIGDSNPNKRKTTCPHCSSVGGYAGMKRWHFDNCKLKN